MNLWQEMRRRRIFRLAGIYIVGAWVVIQVAATFFPAWNIPDAALRYLLFAAIAGFPIAIVFGWFYDITGDGIKRTPPAAGGERPDLRLAGTDFAILAALALVAIAVLYGSFEKVRETTEDFAAAGAKLPNSVAVLPFRNIGDDPDTRFFSDGVTEEILHQLASFDVLNVLARTSSFAFRASDLAAASVSDVLGVRYLLQGSVRRDSSRVRVTASLVDENGFQLWTDTFDRELTSILAIQSEIANTVAARLVEEIAPRDIAPARRTENFEAYQQYLIGRDYINRRPPNWADNALEAFRRAIELDPDFAQPHADTAVVLAIRGTPNDIEEAQPYIRRALELQPDLAEALAAHGLLLSTGQDADLAAAEIELRRAIEADPNLIIAYNWLAIVVKNQGRFAEGNALFEQALERDPLNPILVVNVANIYANRGDVHGAEKLISRLLELPEPPGSAYWELRRLYNNSGRLDKVVEITKEIVLAYGPQRLRDTLAVLAGSYEHLGMTDDSDYYRNLSISSDPWTQMNVLRRSYPMKLRGQYGEMKLMFDEFLQRESLDLDALDPFLGRIFGAIYISVGDYDAGIELLESRMDLESPQEVGRGGATDAIEMLQALAYAYQQLGDADRARIILESNGRYFETWRENDVSFAGKTGELYAANRLMLGDTDGALRALEAAIDAGWRDYYYIINDFRWQAAVERPEFGALLNWVKTDLDRQRARVEAADAEEDFAAIVEEML